jgi:mRNA-degrading endonuclease RelE of RelBE toxin-antitoxin system
MSEEKKSVLWAPEARDQLRAIDREVALQILRSIDDFLTTGTGDVKKLRPPRTELRLRVGDYRVFFYQPAPKSIHIIGVKHRSEAYR